MPMALTDCLDCGYPVSTQALACPHCGAPVPAPDTDLLLGCLGCLDYLGGVAGCLWAVLVLALELVIVGALVVGVVDVLF